MIKRIIIWLLMNSTGETQWRGISIGTLPERRMNPARITKESVMNWAREILGKCVDLDSLFFVTITLDKN